MSEHLRPEEEPILDPEEPEVSPAAELEEVELMPDEARELTSGEDE